MTSTSSKEQSCDIRTNGGNYRLCGCSDFVSSCYLPKQTARIMQNCHKRWTHRLNEESQPAPRQFIQASQIFQEANFSHVNTRRNLPSACGALNEVFILLTQNEMWRDVGLIVYTFLLKTSLGFQAHCSNINVFFVLISCGSLKPSLDILACHRSLALYGKWIHNLDRCTCGGNLKFRPS